MTVMANPDRVESHRVEPYRAEPYRTVVGPSPLAGEGLGRGVHRVKRLESSVLRGNAVQAREA